MERFILKNIMSNTNERSDKLLKMKGHTEQYSLCPRMLLHIKVQIEQYKLKI